MSASPSGSHFLTVVALVLFLGMGQSSVHAFTDDAAIRKAIIKESLESYSGSCPCPYNRDRAGRKCGKRSAYDKPGGAEPVCFESDVTDDMIARYLQVN